VIFEDDECDREADNRVGDASAEGDGDRAGDDAEGDEAVDACVLPSAIRAGLESLRPPRSLTWAAISLPTNPIASVAASRRGELPRHSATETRQGVRGRSPLVATAALPFRSRGRSCSWAGGP
jgi:hypothetical protein